MNGGRGTVGVNQDFRDSLPPLTESKFVTGATRQPKKIFEENSPDDIDNELRFSAATDPRFTMPQFFKDIRGTADGNDFDPRASRPTNLAKNDMRGSLALANLANVQNLGPFFDCSQGRPLQLVHVVPETGDFRLNADVYTELKAYQGNVSFVTIIGKYKTGKSFLLNRLLNLKGEQFLVDPKTKSCTEGIWIWSQPIYIEEENTHVFFIDTEGANSPNRTSSHDVKILALAVLISSLLIYNSVGPIDENAINELSLIQHLSKNIAVNTSGGPSSDSVLSYYTPKFIWLLRDSILEIQDDQGNLMSPAQYLENALTDTSTIAKSSKTNKKIRQTLVKLFPDRDCLYLMRPIQDERLSTKIGSLNENMLRPEFKQQLNVIRENIINKVTPKPLHGINLNMTTFIAMVENYIDTLNEGKIPNISTAWEHVVARQCQDAIHETKELYEYALNEYFNKIPGPKELEVVYNILKNIRDGSLEKYSKATAFVDRGEQAAHFKEEIRKYLDEQERLAVEKNEEEALIKNEELLNTFAQHMKEKTDQKYYDDTNSDQFYFDFMDIIKKYAVEGSQSLNRNEILVAFFDQFFKESMEAMTTKVLIKYNKLSEEAIRNKKKEDFYLKQMRDLENRLIEQEKEIADLEEGKVNEKEQCGKMQKDLLDVKAQEPKVIDALQKQLDEDTKRLEYQKKQEAEELQKRNAADIAELIRQRKKKACCKCKIF